MKNIILKAITAIMTVLLIFGMCSMDSENQIIPSIAIIVSVVWLGLFMYANRGRWSNAE